MSKKSGQSEYLERCRQATKGCRYYVCAYVVLHFVLEPYHSKVAVEKIRITLPAIQDKWQSCRIILVKT